MCFGDVVVYAQTEADALSKAVIREEGIFQRCRQRVAAQVSYTANALIVDILCEFLFLLPPVCCFSQVFSRSSGVAVSYVCICKWPIGMGCLPLTACCSAYFAHLEVFWAQHFLLDGVGFCGSSHTDVNILE